MNAVEVFDVSFKYQRANVLKNIYMTVPKNCVYALLGPSGSGKTTLLRLMLGRNSLQTGTISVFSHNEPGYFNRIIGYMPQSQALSMELTVGETIDYFANLYQLPRKKFLRKKENLQKVFHLADDTQLVSTLSGGQQKSLSLALVFLHSPKLVFLDEPTVGTDPILGDQIWSYLKNNCCKGLTVIIVTHYLQEASLADNVGMMRSGEMIEEGTPATLYEKYNELNLETIFIKICTTTTTEDKGRINQRIQSYQKDIRKFLTFDDPLPSMDKSLVYAKKNSAQIELDSNILFNSVKYSWLWLLFILIWRNIQRFTDSKMTSVMAFSPTFCTLLLCICFKVDQINLHAAIFSQDHSPANYSRGFENSVKNFSTHHIRYDHYQSLNEAVQAVENGKALAALWFEEDFSESFVKRAIALAASTPQASTAAPKTHTDDDDHHQDDQSTTIAMTSTNVYVTTEPTVTELLSTIDVTTTTPLIRSRNFFRKPIDDEKSGQTTTGATSTTERTTLTTMKKTKKPQTTMKKTNRPAKNQRNGTRTKRQIEDIDTEEEEEEIDNVYEGMISKATLNSSSIKVYLDNSNMFYATPMLDLISYGSWELLNQAVRDQNLVTPTSPVHIQEIVYAEGTDMPDFLLSGYMIAFIYLSQVTLTSQLLILERNDGFFDRAIVAGAKHSLMFFSHFITSLILALIQIFCMFVIGFVWYQIPNFGSFPLTFVLVFFQSTSSIMTGLLISAICRENFSAFFIALSITLSQLFTSGAIFPIISFDPVIKFFLSITPISMPVESLRNVMLRGWHLDRIEVLHGLLANIGITIVFGVMALFFFKRRS